MTNSLEIVDSVEDDYYDVDADNSNDSLTLLGHNKNSDDVVPWFFTDKTMSLSGKSDFFKKYISYVLVNWRALEIELTENGSSTTTTTAAAWASSAAPSAGSSSKLPAPALTSSPVFSVSNSFFWRQILDSTQFLKDDIKKKFFSNGEN